MERKRIMLAISDSDLTTFEELRKKDGDRTKSSLLAKWIRQEAKNG